MRGFFITLAEINDKTLKITKEYQKRFFSEKELKTLKDGNLLVFMLNEMIDITDMKK